VASSLLDRIFLRSTFYPIATPGREGRALRLATIDQGTLDYGQVQAAATAQMVAMWQTISPMITPWEQRLQILAQQVYQAALQVQTARNREERAQQRQVEQQIQQQYNKRTLELRRFQHRTLPECIRRGQDDYNQRP